jgi:L-rhamnose mutarotase
MKTRLKPGMTEVYLNFTKQVLNRKDELMDSIREQGIIAAHIFLERSEDGGFIYFYLKSEDLAKNRDIFYSAQRKIDREMIDIISATWDSSQAARLEPVAEI